MGIGYKIILYTTHTGRPLLGTLYAMDCLCELDNQLGIGQPVQSSTYNEQQKFPPEAQKYVYSSSSSTSGLVATLPNPPETSLMPRFIMAS